jgi:hypothetical protein
VEQNLQQKVGEGLTKWRIYKLLNFDVDAQSTPYHFENIL